MIKINLSTSIKLYKLTAVKYVVFLSKISWGHSVTVDKNAWDAFPDSYGVINCLRSFHRIFEKARET